MVTKIEPSGGHAYYDMKLIGPGTRIAPFSTEGAAKVDSAGAALEAEAGKLHLTVKQWTAASPVRRTADVKRLRDSAEEATAKLFPDGGAALAAEILAMKLDLIVVHWPGAKHTFPWQLLWLPANGKWLGEIVAIASHHRFPQAADFGKMKRNPLLLAAYAEDDTLASARADLSAPSVRQSEHSAFSQLTSKTDIFELLPLSAGGLSNLEHDEFNKWLGRGRHIYHIAAHSTGGTASNPLAAFLVRSKAEVRSINFRKRMSPAAYLLNVCGSAVGLEKDEDSLASVVLKSGARGGVATTNKIADRFGTLFARELYRQLEKQGGSFFKALRETQRRLMGRSNHPMALFYTIHGDPNLILRQ